MSKNKLIKYDAVVRESLDPNVKVQPFYAFKRNTNYANINSFKIYPTYIFL